MSLDVLDFVSNEFHKKTSHSNQVVSLIRQSDFHKEVKQKSTYTLP